MTPLPAVVDVREALYSRRSVRSYTGRKPERAPVHDLLDAAVQAPTAIHEEPWQFVIVQDEARPRRLSDRAKELLATDVRRLPLDHGPRGLDAFSQPGFNIFYDAGTLIVIRARPLGPFVVAGCWLAAGDLMLAARGLGLGTCVIGSAVAALNEGAAKRVPGIPADSTAIAPLIVGTPRGAWPTSRRRAPRILGWG